MSYTTIHWEGRAVDPLVHIYTDPPDEADPERVMCGLWIPPGRRWLHDAATCPRCIAISKGDVVCSICNHLASEHAGVNGHSHYGNTSTGACGCVLSKDQVRSGKEYRFRIDRGRFTEGTWS